MKATRRRLFWFLFWAWAIAVAVLLGYVLVEVLK